MTLKGNLAGGETHARVVKSKQLCCHHLKGTEHIMG